LKAIGSVSVCCFGFDDSNHIVSIVAKNVVGSFLLAPTNSVLKYDDSTISEGLLLSDLIISPACVSKLGKNVFSASVRFADGRLKSPKRG
jgi:hypothetical protein